MNCKECAEYAGEKEDIRGKFIFCEIIGNWIEPTKECFLFTPNIKETNCR